MDRSRTKGGPTSKLSVACEQRKGVLCGFTRVRDTCSGFTILPREQVSHPASRPDGTATRGVPSGKRLYNLRYQAENLLAKRKDWRGRATRYNRRAPVFHSAVLLVAVLIFWRRVLSLAFPSRCYDRRHAATKGRISSREREAPS